MRCSMTALPARDMQLSAGIFMHTPWAVPSNELAICRLLSAQWKC
jgi:hypothetical protein